MSTFARSPKLLRRGIALLDPDDGAVQQSLLLQHNPGANWVKSQHLTCRTATNQFAGTG